MQNCLDITNEYSFVLLTLFFKTGKNNESCCGVTLLIDEYNWIHDYKIKWKQLSITQFTTASHFYKNRNKSKRFEFRNKILEAVGLENIPNPSSRKKKSYKKLTQLQVDKVNELFNNEWIGQSFSNIDYIITGSNASGQGNPKNASFYWKSNNNQKFNIGFLFQSLRLTFNRNKLRTKEYKDAWEKYVNNPSNFKCYLFDTWLNENHILKDDFLFFNQNLTRQQQREKIKKIKDRYCPERKKFDGIYNIVDKYRQNIHNDLIKIKKEFTKETWSAQFEDNFIKMVEFAHIKPVNAIKKECIKNGFDENVLLEIKDKNNVLPLDPNTHTLFDKHEICWNLEGKLFFTNNNINDGKLIRPEFKQIPKKTLFKIHKYLIWYHDNHTKLWIK